MKNSMVIFMICLASISLGLFLGIFYERITGPDNYSKKVISIEINLMKEKAKSGDRVAQEALRSLAQYDQNFISPHFMEAINKP